MKRSTLSRVNALLTAGLTALGALTAQAQNPAANETSVAPQRAILILDGSGSMWDSVDGNAKILIARQVIQDLVKDWNPRVELGLLVYGHREKGNCEDIELMIPPGPVNAEYYMEVVSSINPKGKTPLTDSVIAAAEFLNFTEEKATVILVSDGIETCDRDPCDAAEMLAQKGIDFKAHVVGFDLSAEDQKAIECLATNTGGKFLAAKDAPELQKALTTVVEETIAEAPAPAPIPEPQPQPEVAEGEGAIVFQPLLVEGGEVAKDAYFYIDEFEKDLEGNRARVTNGGGPEFKLNAGKYIVQAKWGEALVQKEIEVIGGTRLEIPVIFNAGILNLTARASSNSETVDAYYYIDSTKTDLQGNRERIANGGGPQFKLPAGKYLIQAKWGEAWILEEVEVAANKAVDFEFDMNAGILRFDAVTDTEGDSVTGDTYFYILDPKPNLRGENERITNGGGPDFILPAGKYLVDAKWGDAWARVETEVTAGSLNETTVNLNAGILVINAKDSKGNLVDCYKYIYKAESNPDGSLERVTNGGGSDFYLPAGKYIVDVKEGEMTGRAEIEVTAGSRVIGEVTIGG